MYLDIPIEKWLNYLQTVDTLIKRHSRIWAYCLPITLLGASRLKQVKYNWKH